MEHDDHIPPESIGLLHLSSEAESTSDLTELRHRRRRRRQPRHSGWNPNPLPWAQLSVVLFGRVCDALASQSIQPYINQLVGELDIVGGDQRKVGYYVGLIESLYQAALTTTILQWNRLSDYVGRKPVLLIGTFGSMVSTLWFGLSRTFWGLVASRCLWGLLDANVGIVKSIVGEITDSTNRAKGFALIFVLWAVGGTFGPLIGGTLAKPADRFPAQFTSDFWKRYPYFLPCFSVSIFIAASFLVTLFFFQETVSKKSFPARRHQTTEESSFLAPEDKPLPLRQILTYPVIISVSNYACLSFLGTCHAALFSLFFAMPIPIGGLGFAPTRIGYILGAYRAINAVFMAVWFPRTVHHIGERRAFILAMSSFLVLWALFPIINFCASIFGIGMIVWIGIAFMLLPVICMDMAYSCIYVFVTSAAPNKRSLGATNGVSQTLASIARTVAPALATSLFSFSVQHNLLGGYAVYAVLFVLSCFAVLLALRLPHKPRPVWEEEEELFEDSEEEDVTIELGGQRTSVYPLLVEEIVHSGRSIP